MSKQKVDPEAVKEALILARKTAEEAKANHGLSITRAVEKGEGLARQTFGSDQLTEYLGTAMREGVNGGIAVTSTGLTLADGYFPTEQEVSSAVSQLCKTKEETAKFITTLSWSIGDAALLSENFEGGIDRVVAQAISERGVTKFTVMQMVRVCRAFPYGQRIPGASITHHQESYRVNPQLGG